jgi:Phosphotransferase enzyme family
MTIPRYDPGVIEAATRFGPAVRIADLFDLGGGAVLSDGPIGRGEQGQVWRLDTTGGSWAVKESFRAVDEREVALAADFQDAACSSGVPAPIGRRTGDGQVCADVGDSVVRVYEWIDLLEPDLGLDPSAVGQVLAQIHQVDVVPAGSLDSWYTEPVGADRWNEIGRRLTLAGAPFADEFARMRSEFVALDSWIRPVSAARMCHRDLWADNLLRTASGGLCVIDWEDCGPAQPERELCCLLFEFGADDPVRIRDLYGSYLEHGGPGRVRERQDFSMLIAQLGHICEIVCRDWLDPAWRSTDRQRSAERFAEFVEHPYSRASLEQMLDALR